MNPGLRHLWGRGLTRLVLAVAISAAVIAAAGFALFPDGFAGNLAAEAVGLAMGVVVALALVERVLERERARQWALVGTRTTRAIKRRIWNIAWEYYLKTQYPVIDDDEFMHGIALDQPESTIGETLTRLAASTRAIYQSLRPEADEELDSPRELHQSVESDFDYIKSVLTPRVISLSSDPDLAEMLLRLEDHEEEWRGWMKTTEEWGAPESFAWREATAALEVAAAIYARLAEPDRVAFAPGTEGWEGIPH